jgi:hypothetical protein
MNDRCRRKDRRLSSDDSNINENGIFGNVSVALASHPLTIGSTVFND